MHKVDPSTNLKPSSKFIVFEGCDGCGKTTLLENVYLHLKNQGLRCIKTHEPGGTEIAQKIRQLFSGNHPENQKSEEELTVFSELMLILAARNQHINYKITKALNNQTIILCDRFTDSTKIYQGLKLDFPDDYLNKLLDYACNGLRPCTTILLTGDVKLFRSRALKRTNISDKKNHITNGCGGVYSNQNDLNNAPADISRFDLKDLSYYYKINQAYLALASKTPENYLVLDGNSKLEILTKSTIAHLKKLQVI